MVTDTSPSSRTLPRALGMLTLAGSAVAAWSLFEARWPTLRDVHVPGVVRAGTRPLRVLHLSDLHLSSPRARIVDFIASLAEQDHDLVVVTGDLLGDLDMADDAVAALEPVVASGRPGVVVLGSNDFHGPVAHNPLLYLASDSSNGQHGDLGPELDTDRLVDGLRRRGWQVLRNAATTVDTSQGPVSVTGLDDPHLGAPLPSPTATVPANRGITHLGLVHSPYKAALDHLVGIGSDLVLAGHTHGGQVRVPGVGALVTNCDLPPGQARGLSWHRGVPLHVSAGLGTSKFAPVRFACRPEATLLTLLP